jgi:hypothetical protein
LNWVINRTDAKRIPSPQAHRTATPRRNATAREAVTAAMRAAKTCGWAATSSGSIAPPIDWLAKLSAVDAKPEKNPLAGSTMKIRFSDQTIPMARRSASRPREDSEPRPTGVPGSAGGESARTGSDVTAAAGMPLDPSRGR